MHCGQWIRQRRKFPRCRWSINHESNRRVASHSRFRARHSFRQRRVVLFLTSPAEGYFMVHTGNVRQRLVIQDPLKGPGASG
jgi:hypothetical protein